VNFIIAAGLYLIVRLPQGWPLGDFDYPGTAAGFAQLLITWNLVMGCFNLLPVFPDGRRPDFPALLATRMSYLRATRWAVTVGKVLAVAAAAGGGLWISPLSRRRAFWFHLPRGDMSIARCCAGARRCVPARAFPAAATAPVEEAADPDSLGSASAERTSRRGRCSHGSIESSCPTGARLRQRRLTAGRNACDARPAVTLRAWPTPKSADSDGG